MKSKSEKELLDAAIQTVRILLEGGGRMNSAIRRSRERVGAPPRRLIMTSWDDWCCPHSECIDEGRTYSDPDTVRFTCCDRGHEVRLTWHGGEVQARLHYRGRRLVRGPLQGTLSRWLGVLLPRKDA